MNELKELQQSLAHQLAGHGISTSSDPQDSATDGSHPVLNAPVSNAEVPSSKQHMERKTDLRADNVAVFSPGDAISDIQSNRSAKTSMPKSAITTFAIGSLLLLIAGIISHNALGLDINTYVSNLFTSQNQLIGLIGLTLGIGVLAVLMAKYFKKSQSFFKEAKTATDAHQDRRILNTSEKDVEFSAEDIRKECVRIATRSAQSAILASSHRDETPMSEAERIEKLRSELKTAFVLPAEDNTPSSSVVSTEDDVIAELKAQFSQANEGLDEDPDEDKDAGDKTLKEIDEGAHELAPEALAFDVKKALADLESVDADQSKILCGDFDELTLDFEKQRTDSMRPSATVSDAAPIELLATTSQEIRLPLNGIRGMSHLLAQTDLTAEQDSYLNTIRQSAETLEMLVEDLLDLSCLQSGQFNLREDKFNLRDLVHSVVELLASDAHGKQIEIATIISPDAPDDILCDQRRLRQILFTLVADCIRAMEKGGVLLELDIEAEQIVVKLRLIAKQSNANITNMARAKDKIRYQEGTQAEHNLSIVLARKIAYAMGGHIDQLTSDTNNTGTNVRYTLNMPLTVPRSNVSAQSNAEKRAVAVQNRATILDQQVILMIVPKGPTHNALIASVERFGGKIIALNSTDESLHKVAEFGRQNGPFTDVIVDSRISDQVADEYIEMSGVKINPTARRTIIITPDRERETVLSSTKFSSWLVRPIRGKSLVNVLTGQEDGAELRLKPEMTPELVQSNIIKFTRPVEQRTFEILLADTQLLDGLATKTALAKAGHRVTLVKDAMGLMSKWCEALEQKNHFDIIIADRASVIITPASGKNKDDAITQIRQQEAENEIEPAHIMIFDNKTKQEDLGHADGFDAKRQDCQFIDKPAAPDKILSALAKLQKNKLS